MVVVSTSNLVSSGNEETTAASNFWTMATNFFCYATWFDEVSNRKLFIYIYIYIYTHEAISNFMTAELWKSALRNTYT